MLSSPRSRKRFLTTSAILAVLFIAGIALTLKWIVTDDPELAFSLDYDSIYPAPLNAAESQALLLELSHTVFTFPEDRLEPGSRSSQRNVANNPQSPTIFNQYHFSQLPKEEKLPYLLQYKNEIEATWRQNPELDELLRKLDTYPIIAGHIASFKDPNPIIGGKTRFIAKALAYRAYLLADAGQADLALQELNRLMSIANKSIAGSRQLIESLTWVAVIAICLEPANYILDNYDVSKNTLQTGAENLVPILSPIELIERNFYQETLYLYEYTQELRNLEKNLIPLVLPKASANQIHAHFQNTLRLLKENKLIDLEVYQKNLEDNTDSFRLRNNFGQSMVASSVPSITQFFDLYTKSEQARRNYLAKLETSLKPQSPTQ